MSESNAQHLSSTWKHVCVRDVADSIQYGLTASAIDREDGPRFLRITDIQEGHVDWLSVPSCKISKEDIPKYRLKQGDIVFARTGATTGKSYLIGDCPDAVFASYLIRVRVSQKVDSRYLALFFQSPDYWRQVEAGKRGIGQPNVNGTVLGEIELPLPALEDQRRIVAEIEKQFTRLEAGVAALKRVQANLKRYRAAVLKAACEGKLVPTEAELARKEKRSYETGEQLLAKILNERRKKWQGRGKYKEPALPDTTNLSELPEGWTYVALESLTLKASDGEHFRPKVIDHGVPFLSAKDVRNHGVVFDDVLFVSPTDAEHFRQRCDPAFGDILVVSRGATVGRCCIVQTEQQFCLLGSVILLKILPQVLNRLVMWILKESQVLKRLIDVSGSTAQQAIYLRDIKKLLIPFPPLAEQERVVAEVERRLSVVEELEVLVSANLQRASRLRQAILQQAFSGAL